MLDRITSDRTPLIADKKVRIYSSASIAANPMVVAFIFLVYQFRKINFLSFRAIRSDYNNNFQFLHTL